MRPIHRLHAFVCILLALLVTGGSGASGLLVPHDRKLPPLRITDHVVDVTINDRVALTTVTQTFRNDHDHRVEATYIFPLPEEGDLTDFRMTFNGKMVQGEVLEANEARQIYESIVRQAKDPGLIEFIGHRLLRMRVFPIEPKSDTTIEVSYQQICRPMSGMQAFHYPLRTSKTGGKAYGTVRFDVEMETREPLKNIWSPTHSVEIVRDGDYRAKIAYEASGGSLEDDFILLYSTDSSDLGLSNVAWRANEKEKGFFLLLLTPKQLWPDEEYQPQDVVFVLDTSGSMAGDKIRQAKEALKYSINQLDERDRFSVVRFSTGFDVLFDDVEQASAEKREEAIRFVDQFAAQGGTNISDTLRHVAGMRPENEEGRPFVVVFLTDGQGNRTPDEIMAAVKEAAGEVDSLRLFPFGVGHDVNTLLLDRLANTYHGRPVYVQPGENLELVLGDFFATISQPVLTDLKLDLPEIGVTERFPVTLGDLYHGQQLTIAGRFSKPATGAVTLTAMRNGQKVEYSWPHVEFTNTEDAEYVAPIWAGRKIAYLIDQIRLHGENEEMIDEVIALSQEYGIQTPYTAWLVNPEGLDPRGPRRVVGGRVGESLERLHEQERRFRGVVPNAPAGTAMPGGGGGRGFGGSGPESEGGIDYYEAADAVREETGKAAHTIARVQESLRQRASGDEARLDPNILAVRKIGNRFYSRIGGFLVDQTVTEKHQLVYILFASDAWFELVEMRPDLKAVLAASANVVVPISESTAVVVLEEAPGEGEGPELQIFEEFTDRLREQLQGGKSSEE